MSVSANAVAVQTPIDAAIAPSLAAFSTYKSIGQVTQRTEVDINGGKGGQHRPLGRSEGLTRAVLSIVMRGHRAIDVQQRCTRSISDDLCANRLT